MDDPEFMLAYTLHMDVEHHKEEVAKGFADLRKKLLPEPVKEQDVRDWMWQYDAARNYHSPYVFGLRDQMMGLQNVSQLSSWSPYGNAVNCWGF